MKKIYLVLLTAFLNLVIFSCTPASVSDNKEEPQACCGDGGHIRK